MNGPIECVRSEIQLAPDPTRVIVRLFVPGQEFSGIEDPTRTGVADRLMALTDMEVAAGVAELIDRFGGRHDDLESTLLAHGRIIVGRSANLAEPSRERTVLLGAAFTTEQSIEAAALCNPSVVAHPDQSGVRPGDLRFAMSVRGIAEGHVSSIGFRTGTLTGDGAIVVDLPGRHPVKAAHEPGPFRKQLFHLHLRALGQDGDSAASVLDALADRFTIAELDDQLYLLRTRHDNPRAANYAAERLRSFAERSYTATFSPEVDLSRRVLVPTSAQESCGIEDARLVRLVEDDDVSFAATYTAYDGHTIAQQLLRTRDFTSFHASPLLGPAAANKGLAIFPRRIGGRYVALSRFDRESNHVAYSDDLHWWDGAVALGRSRSLWEAIQVGNCGSPIETDAGWLVLTHGVGPMRTYGIGALLLDLERPERVIGELATPILTCRAQDRDGYVPNVVYSCGGIVHAGRLVIPHGISDTSIGFGSIQLDELLGALIAAGPAAP